MTAGRRRTNANTLQRLASAQHNTLMETPIQLTADPQVKGAEKKGDEEVQTALNGHGLA